MSSSSSDLVDRLRCLERAVRSGLTEADGARASVKLAEFSQRLAETSQSLAPYDVQALLATQRELTSLVQKFRAARVGSTAFTFKRKQGPGGRDAGLHVGVDEGPRACGAGAGGRDVCAAERGGVTSIDASALDPATSSLVVENRSGAEVRIRKLDALQQVRVRGCAHVVFRLYYNDGRAAADNEKIVVEDSRGLLFGFYDEADGACIPRRTVRDFGWLRAGPSPNVSWLTDE